MKRGMPLPALMLSLLIAAGTGLAAAPAVAAKEKTKTETKAAPKTVPKSTLESAAAPQDNAPPEISPEEQAYRKRIFSNPFYSQIMAAAKTLRGRDMVDFIDMAIQQDSQRMEVIAYWLRDHSFLEKDAAKVNSLYFMAYADVLFWRADEFKAKGDKVSYHAFLKESLQSLYAFEALASADAQRCEDATALQSVRNNMLLNRFDRVLPAYLMFPEETFTAMGKIAVLLEKRFAARPPNHDICGMGAGRILDISKQPGTKKKFVDDPYASGHLRARLVPPPGYVYHSRLIPVKAWNKKRDELDAFLQSDWLRRYVVLKDAAEKQQAAQGAQDEDDIGETAAARQK